jgi:serine/threonine-protein kinase
VLAEMDPLIGRSIGNHTIEECLDSGGGVYLARHPDIGSRVVVKVLLPESLADEESVRRLVDEARAANRIDHPGVVRILDLGVQGTVGMYLVQEYVAGDSLAQLRDRKPALPVPEVAELVRQAASVLAAAHEAGIVHRDITPACIHVVTDPEVPGQRRVKVSGLGLAKLTDPELMSGETEAGTVFGSPRYMSPEQCVDASSIDARADVYALGAVAYELLSGRAPFEGRSLGEVVRQQAAGDPPPPLLSLNPRIPLALAGVIHRALELDRERRFATMNEFVAALQQALHGLDSEAPLPDLAPPEPRPAPESAPPAEPVQVKDHPVEPRPSREMPLDDLEGPTFILDPDDLQQELQPRTPEDDET